MDLLDRLLRHDAWTTRSLLVLSAPLPDAELDRAFDVGHRTLRVTFVHILGSMEVWTDLIRERPVRGWDSGALDSMTELLARHDVAAPDFAAIARQVADEGRWDALFTDVLDDPPARKTFGGAIGHVLTHGMQHRGEAMHVMTRLGVPDVPEGDLLGWESAIRAGSA